MYVIDRVDDLPFPKVNLVRGVLRIKRNQWLRFTSCIEIQTYKYYKQVNRKQIETLCLNFELWAILKYYAIDPLLINRTRANKWRSRKGAAPH